MEMNSYSPINLSNETHLVVFRLSHQNFALPIEPVYQIIEMVTIIPLPKADPLVEGVINVRGKMVPVVDMRRFMNYTILPFTLHTPIILIKLSSQMLGLIVDEVLNVLGLQRSQVAESTEFLPAGLGSIPILQGIANTPEGTLVLLDLDHLFDPGQRQALIQAVAALANADPSLSINRDNQELDVIEQPLSDETPINHTVTKPSKLSKKKKQDTAPMIDLSLPGELSYDDPIN